MYKTLIRQPSGGMFLIGSIFLTLLLSSPLHMFYAGMNMSDAQMTPCPFMGESAVCNMNLLEHLTAWQNAFATIVEKGRDITLLLVGLAFLLIVGLWRQPHGKQKQILLLQRWRAARKEYLCIFDTLQEAFSNGILNPKTF